MEAIMEIVGTKMAVVAAAVDIMDDTIPLPIPAGLPPRQDGHQNNQSEETYAETCYSG